MIVFLDTKFTDVLQPQLLSIGMATMTGKFFYAELDLTSNIGKARVKASTEFVRTGGVLDQWGLVPGSTYTVWDMGLRAAWWLLDVAEETNEQLQIAFDLDVDYELLESAIDEVGRWEKVRKVVGPLNVDVVTGTLTGETAAEKYYGEIAKRGALRGERGFRRHHALADALALREAYATVKAEAIVSAAEARRQQA